MKIIKISLLISGIGLMSLCLFQLGLLVKETYNVDTLEEDIVLMNKERMANNSVSDLKSLSFVANEIQGKFVENDIVKYISLYETYLAKSD